MPTGRGDWTPGTGQAMINTRKDSMSYLSSMTAVLQMLGLWRRSEQDQGTRCLTGAEASVAC